MTSKIMLLHLAVSASAVKLGSFYEGEYLFFTQTYQLAALHARKHIF